MAPAIQPIYQNVLEICLDVGNFYWLTWLQVSLTCHFIQILSKALISTLELEFILSRGKTHVSALLSSGSTGKYQQKRVKDLITENLLGKWDVSQPFFFYSRAP